MAADLEIHITRNGYVGLCRLKDEVNVCGLFRSATTLPGLAREWRKTLCGEPGSELEKRLANADLDEQSFCSIAGLDVAPHRIKPGEPCKVGDALTMTPPVTGNGMSMAFESAELAATPLAQYSSGDICWTAATQKIAKDCQRRFAKRLKCAGILHKIMFSELGGNNLRRVLPRFPQLVELLFRFTR